MSATIEQLVRQLEDEIPAAMAARDLPGLAIGIRDGDGTRWSRGFETTVRGGGAPVTTATRFSVQSTSKLVTATAAMVAAAQGLVDLDAPIADLLPEFSVNSVFDRRPCRLITLRHLLSHTAGFTHEAPDGSNYDLGSGDFDGHCASIAGHLAALPGRPPPRVLQPRHRPRRLDPPARRRRRPSPTGSRASCWRRWG